MDPGTLAFIAMLGSMVAFCLNLHLIMLDDARWADEVFGDGAGRSDDADRQRLRLPRHRA